jgi:hypothetical protein
MRRRSVNHQDENRESVRPGIRHEAAKLGVDSGVEARSLSLPEDVARQLRTLLCQILVADMHEHPVSRGTDNPVKLRSSKQQD